MSIQEALQRIDSNAKIYTENGIKYLFIPDPADSCYGGIISLDDMRNLLASLDKSKEALENLIKVSQCAE